MSERSELESQLLRKPFDVGLRARYAGVLGAERDWPAALEQWSLLSDQAPNTARPLLMIARCRWELGDPVAARASLERSRACPDFADQEPLSIAEVEGLLPEPGAAPAPGPAPPRLRAISGGRVERPERGADVVSISRAELVRFSDVVGMSELKQVLKLQIIQPFLSPGLFQRFKKKSGGGVLLYGPPGCGKTMIAKAIASECKAAFTAVGISEILNMWIGESERNLAAIFDKARQEAPAVLFFDELDALAFSRSKARSEHTRTLVNEFLSQLDGMQGKNDKLLVLAATNMPWDVDDAMKRPGRFDRQVFVPPPDSEARAEMYRLKLQDVPVDSLDYAGLGQRSERFSGADIDGVIDRAKEKALLEMLESGTERALEQRDFEQAIADVEPSTLDWLKTARTLVKYGGAASSYRDVDKYLRREKLY